MPEEPEGSDAAAFFRQLGEQTSKVLTAAEEAARGIREQARRDAAGIVAEARLQADELSRAAATRRRAAEEELRRFREARGVMANQIEDVHRRLEEIILRLRAPIDAPESQPATPGASGPDAMEAVQPVLTVAGPDATAADQPGSGRQPALLPATQPAPGAAAPVDREASAGPQAPRESEFPPAPEREGLDIQSGLEISSGLELHASLPEEVIPPNPEPVGGSEAAGEHFEYEAFRLRAEAIGEAPLLAGRNLKRLLQEDQNDLLDRLRRNRGRGNFDETIFPATVQVHRFVEGLRSVLEPAFAAGRRAGGAPTIGQPPDAVGLLVSKQVVAPLRRDLARMIEPRLAAGDTATTVSERAGDVYRVWKGVRTELLGEGLAYASFHHGLLDAWREVHGPGKRWAVSPDEADCPRDTCRANAAAGVVPLDASFPSGHLAPPAHGACTCTVVAPEE
jgi:hypothetical protein